MKFSFWRTFEQMKRDVFVGLSGRLNSDNLQDGGIPSRKLNLGWEDYEPEFGAAAPLTLVSIDTRIFSRWCRIGSTVFVASVVQVTLGGAPGPIVYMSLPVPALYTPTILPGRYWDVTEGALYAYPTGAVAGMTAKNLQVLQCKKYNAANWNAAANKIIYVTGFYEADKGY